MGVDNAGAARYFHFPHLIINPGDVESIADEEALSTSLPSVAPVVSKVEAVQVGSTGVNVGFRATVGERLVQGILMVKIDDGRWGIKGRSLMIS